MKILVTGGAGYIGSHTCLELILAGHKVVVVDNFVNGSIRALSRAAILGKATVMGDELNWEDVNLLDAKKLNGVFKDYGPFDAVFHFAGHKSVAESVEDPIRYYHNNVAGTTTLLQAMQRHKVPMLVFSSSSTVYEPNRPIPYYENSPIRREGNAYAMSKVMIEDILWAVPKGHIPKICSLRYFNPVGAHQSGMIGEAPIGRPNNLMPFITQVAVGQRKKLLVYGDNYPTHDGTASRDYVHVVDVARGHLKALEFLVGLEDPAGCVFNLGTGRPTTVLDVVKTFESTNNVKIPIEMVDRRPGDAAESYANTKNANTVLHWTPEFTLEDMCRDAWRWQEQNPNGYQ